MMAIMLLDIRKVWTPVQWTSDDITGRADVISYGTDPFGRFYPKPYIVLAICPSRYCTWAMRLSTWLKAATAGSNSCPYSPWITLGKRWSSCHIGDSDLFTRPMLRTARNGCKLSTRQGITLHCGWNFMAVQLLIYGLTQTWWHHSKTSPTLLMSFITLFCNSLLEP